MKTLRIGVTSREVRDPGTGEIRDALSRSWGAFMTAALPLARWLPVPNIGAPVRGFAEKWELNGFILTGGDDFTGESARDETEQTLLETALEEKMPVYGVCRGMQMLQIYFGGALARCPDGAHVARRHSVSIETAGLVKNITVNSYHNMGIRKGELVAELSAFATTDDGYVEGVSSPEMRLCATMWHPEREESFALHDIRRFQALFRE